ncbi:MAG: hypothetical protein U0903_18205 [Planctomycetales bacterium]
MSTINLDGFKVILPRSGADEFWQKIHEHYAQDDDRKWKYLAMLALRENAGWPLTQIGQVFGHPKGHVSRCLESIKSELRARFAVQWEEAGFSNPGREPIAKSAGEVKHDADSNHAAE